MGMLWWENKGKTYGNHGNKNNDGKDSFQSFRWFYKYVIMLTLKLIEVISIRRLGGIYFANIFRQSQSSAIPD
jgi:hypothetical protein